MATKQGKRIIWTLAIAAALTAAAISAFAFSFGRFEKVKASGGVVSIPQAKVADGKAHFFRFDDNGREIAFFVAKASDGSYRTAFDACDVCYREKKGYQQKGGVMVCINCNQRFATDRIGPNATGGCNPSYLPHREGGGAITVNVADLKSGARFF